MAQPAPVAVGVVLTHLKALCQSAETGPQRSSGVRPEDNVILNYGRAEVRAQAQADLAAMHDQGAAILRTVLWYHHAEDVRTGRRGDQLGLVEAAQGRLPDQAVANLMAFASDARDRGYGMFSIALGPQGHANPKCREREIYGACYQPELLDLTWQVTDQVAAALLPLERPGFQILLDISPEDCPSGRAGPLLEKNETDYTREMVTRFSRKYGHGFSVSCGGHPAARGLAGLKALNDIYRAAGARPSAIDVHLYATDPSEIDTVLGAADRMAKSYRAPLYVMETYADNAGLYAEASRLKASGRTPSLAGVTMWPKNAADACHVSLTPPYDLRRFTGRAAGP
jgi:hypothetical protein